MSESDSEKPMTFLQLTTFYREVMRPEMEQITASQVTTFYREVTRPETEQTIFARLAVFYHDVMRPELEQMVEERLEVGLRPLRDEMHQGFDDLYKKFETLEQEYVFANIHIKRLNQAVFDKKKIN